MKTNKLKYSETKIKGDFRHTVNIRLNDECKNGHQDFSITMDTYEKKGNGRYYEYAFGCQHDEIKKVFGNKFNLFIDLHLSDYKGAPMYAIANGFYHIRKGFEKGDKEQTFCEYYRVTPEQYKVLNESENELEYALNLMTLGVLDYWECQANEAIKQLESLTGNEFVNDSEKSNLDMPSEEKIQEFLEKKKSGYYSSEEKERRRQERLSELKTQRTIEIRKETDGKIKKARIEEAVILFVLDFFGYDFNNFIFYDHSNTINFNWKSYETKITKEQFDKFNEALKYIEFPIDLLYTEIKTKLDEK